MYRLNIEPWTNKALGELPKKIKENRLSPKEKEKIIFEENMNMFPIRSKFFNERFRRAVVKSACRYGASNLTLAFREYLIQNRPHLDYPYQKTIMRTTIKTLSNEWAAGRWAMADRESALLMLILTPFMTKNDALLYALEAAIDAITFMDLTPNMIQALSKLSVDQPAAKHCLMKVVLGTCYQGK